MEGSVPPKGHLGMRKRRNEGWRQGDPNASLERLSHHFRASLSPAM